MCLQRSGTVHQTTQRVFIVRKTIKQICGLFFQKFERKLTKT